MKLEPNCLCPISKSLPVGESLQFFHVVESLRESPWCAASRSSNHWQLASSQHRCHGIGSLRKDGSWVQKPGKWHQLLVLFKNPVCQKSCSMLPKPKRHILHGIYNKPRNGPQQIFASSHLLRGHSLWQYDVSFLMQVFPPSGRIVQSESIGSTLLISMLGIRKGSLAQSVVTNAETQKIQ